MSKSDRQKGKSKIYYLNIHPKSRFKRIPKQKLVQYSHIFCCPIVKIYIIYIIMFVGNLIQILYEKLKYRISLLHKAMGLQDMYRGRYLIFELFNNKYTLDI